MQSGFKGAGLGGASPDSLWAVEAGLGISAGYLADGLVQIQCPDTPS